AYHGHADSVMGMSAEKNGQLATQPISPGTPQGAVDDLWVLPYDEPESLEFIRNNGASIAAVFVEPVQSRNPGLQPREFLHDLRKLTTDTGSLLVFDEMITGFRTCPGGAQEFFGVRADLATYGKVLGGGMPIGVVAGKANLMDPLDGGAWQYGDNSYPEVNRIVFGGTFCQHPLAMTASLATLRYLKEKGPGLQEELNDKTAKLAGELNNWFDEEEVPIKIVWFGSLFRFDFSTNLELLFYHMNLRGIFVWEWRNCFLSTAHTDEDIARIVQVVKESVLAMREGGFIPPKPGGDKAVGGNNTAGTRTASGNYPLNSAQQQLATLAEISPEGSRAYHVSAQLSISGTIDKKALSEAVDRVVERHEALRSVIRGVDRQEVLPPTPGLLQSTDLSGEKNIEETLPDWLRRYAGSPMDLEKGPLFTAHLIKTDPGKHRLILKGHHIIMDGLSMNL
ncbi:MAG: aminotransferase class III-fold pyridoxal phosphate-dependent enzyme, partial [Balneolaceae bacterium]